MNGLGTRSISPAARRFKALIDISRLVSRVGYGPHTGVDRVELAYLQWCLDGEAPLLGLARVAGGFALLDRAGLILISRCLTGQEAWGRRDLRGVVGLKTPNLRSRAESEVRRQSVVFNNQPEFPDTDLTDFTYLNTGHANLSRDNLSLLKAQIGRVVVFLHDVIPLEFTQFQKQGSVAKFKEMVKTIDDLADIVIVNSQDTAVRSQVYLRVDKPVIVAHLGIEVPEEVTAETDKDRPYFITIGTIEPRKNHKLLLDVWELMNAEEAQVHLDIVGRRGWKNEDVFARLDDPKIRSTITEHSDLPDADMWSLLKGANALLFPSLAEGFGLPSLEAAALGVPVICGDLAIHRELLGDYPVYVDLHDPYLWKKTILEQTQAKPRPSQLTPHIPSWDEHFARVNQAITDQR